MLKTILFSAILLFSFLSIKAKRVFPILDSLGKMPVFEGFIGGELNVSTWNAGNFYLDYIDDLDRLNELLPVYGKARVNFPWLSCYIDYSKVILRQDISASTNDVFEPSGNAPNYEMNIGTTFYIFKTKIERNTLIKLKSEYISSSQTYVTGFNTPIPHHYWLGIDGGYYERKFPMVYREEDVVSKFFGKALYWDSYGVSGFYIGLSLRDIVAYKMTIFSDELELLSTKKKYYSCEYGIRFIFTNPLPGNPPHYNYFEFSQLGLNIWAVGGGTRFEFGLLPGRIKDWFFRMTYTIPIRLGNIIALKNNESDID